jgi:hypothetical protein
VPATTLFTWLENAWSGVRRYPGAMGQLGEMFPGRKLDDQGKDEAGSGQTFEPGPLDLDGGVIHMRRRATAPEPSQEDTES